MKYIKHIIPLLGISIVTVFIFQLFYINITGYEEERCWNELQTTVADLNKEIKIKFTDEISKLHLIETIMENTDDEAYSDMSYLHIDKVQPGTMFTRIDVLYPDNTLLSNGKLHEITEDLSFDTIKTKGEYLTERKTDFMNNKPCLYYVLPITKQEEIVSVLIGVIDCDTLNELFSPVLYNGNANVCIIDSNDGNYIVDNWHSELGNMYSMDDRELLPEFVGTNFKEEIKNLKSGPIGFVSKTVGSDIYMYYAPTGVFGWETAVFTNEDVLFSNLLLLRKRFILAGAAELILLVIYCLWNIWLIRRLQKANKEIKGKQERLEFLSYRDILTSLFNRHKYLEMLSEYIKAPPQNVGVAYIDLNGLKQINDSSSHEAGDQYICNTANALRLFFEDHCYRIGGDEFVIISTDTDQADFNDRIEKLKAGTDELKVSLSIGYLWRESCDDITKMLSTAEKDMYKVKREYYKTQNAEDLKHCKN